MHTDTPRMQPTITAEDTLNTIIERYPTTLPVLQRFGLDTCCGGSLPLQVAAQHHNLPVDAVLNALYTVVETQAP